MYAGFGRREDASIGAARHARQVTIGLLLTLAALAVVDSASFGTLGVPVFLLLAPDRDRVPRLMIYLATVALFYFAVGVALMLGLSAALENLGDALQSRPAYWVQLVAGVGLFALSFRFDPKRQRERGGPERRFDIRRGGPWAMVLLGLTAGLLEVATMVPYLAAMGFMTTSGLPVARWVPLLAAYVIIMITPALVLLALRGVAGAWLEPILQRLRAWMSRNAVSAVGWTLAIVGFLIARDAAYYLFFR